MTTLDKHAAMYDRIEKHGRQLLAIFPRAKQSDPIKLCKALRRLEGEGNGLGLRLCNGPQFTSEAEKWAAGERILTRVQILLGYATGEVAVMLNLDPRGYALKIDDQWMREHKAELHRDWGGYGIIAPDLANP